MRTNRQRYWIPALLAAAWAACAPAVAQEDPVVTGDETNGVEIDIAKEIDDASAYPHIELLTEALIHIRKHYVEEKSYKEITYGALHGMLGSLDAHSSFMEPEEYKEMREDTAGQFGGIGIHIGMRQGVLTVIAPIEDTPAFRAGLQAGDQILEVNGEKTAGMSLREAVKLLRGDKGSAVTIKVRSLGKEGGYEEARDVEIVRDEIKVVSAKGAKMLENKISYIRLTQFSRSTAESLQTDLDELQGEGMEALILDLRNNPGGLLTSAVDVAQQFLRKGEVIVTTRGRPGVHEEIATRARGSVQLTDFPMAILVNGGSASASEIVAGALQDHKRAVLVGTKTFGKGSVQSVIPISQDEKTAVRLTIAHYYTPSDRLIHEKGIEPDIEVELSPDEWRRVLIARQQKENPAVYSDEEKAEYADAVDTQLRRAVDLLTAVKIFQ